MLRILLVIVGLMFLSACATQRQVSAEEAIINDIAREKAKTSRFPILVPLPSAGEVVGEGIPAETATDLKGAASELGGFKQIAAAAPDDLETEATVAELRAMIASLRAGRTAAPLRVDVEALGFPTPPPLEP